MITSYLIGTGAMIILMVLWLLVQRQWGKSFADQLNDEDVLAGRSNCGNCGCTTYCEKNESNK